MSGEVEIPDFVRERLERIASRLSLPFEEVVKQYLTYYNDPWIQSSDQFRSDYERHSYAIRVFITRVLGKPPTVEYIVIPFGYKEPVLSKRSGTLVARIYAYARPVGVPEEQARWSAKVILARDRQAGLWRDVQLFTAYKTKFFDQGGNVLVATDDTDFSQPYRSIEMDPRDFLEKRIGVKRFKLIDVYDNLSSRRGGFVDEFDLRAMEAVILDYRVKQRPDGRCTGIYFVSDESIAEDIVDEEGRVIPHRLPVFISPSLMKYDVDSIVYIYGTVRLDPQERPIMDAIGVIPLYPRPIPQVPSCGGESQ